MPPLPKPARLTLEEFLALPEDLRVEFIGGEVVEKAAPGGEHGLAQLSAGRCIQSSYQRKPGGRSPGGWWILTEVDVQLGGEIYRPDLCGWRRERAPESPRGRPIALRPDWICEVVSPSHARNDRVVKMLRYHQAGVPNYWLLDPADGTLTVMRYSEAGYVTILAATREETVRAEPFDALPLKVAELLGDDPEE